MDAKILTLILEKSMDFSLKTSKAWLMPSRITVLWSDGDARGAPYHGY